VRVAQTGWTVGDTRGRCGSGGRRWSPPPDASWAHVSSSRRPLSRRGAAKRMKSVTCTEDRPERSQEGCIDAPFPRPRRCRSGRQFWPPRPSPVTPPRQGRLRRRQARCKGCHTTVKNPSPRRAPRTPPDELKAWIRTPKDMIAEEGQEGYHAGLRRGQDRRRRPAENLVAYMATMK